MHLGFVFVFFLFVYLFFEILFLGSPVLELTRDLPANCLLSAEIKGVCHHLPVELLNSLLPF